MSSGELGIVRSPASDGSAPPIVPRAGGGADGLRVRACGRAGPDRPRASVASLRSDRVSARAGRRRLTANGARDLLPAIGLGRAVAGALPAALSIARAGGT